MPTYAYTAVDPNGRTIKGKTDAENESIVVAKLHEQKYHVIGITEEKSRASTAPGAVTSPGRKVKLKNLVVFSRQFATMIDAGVAIVRCLDILEGQTKDPVLKPVIAQCKKDVKGGMSLTDAFGKHPNVFSRLYVNMVKAAEAGGILDKILDRLATFL
ncbi:MAG: type II secretion system F family protein, partial [Armatimonadota bacterium]